MRDLPAATLVKNEDYTASHNSWIVRSNSSDDDTTVFGNVIRDDGTAWHAYVTVTHGEYGAGIRFEGRFRTRQTALIRVLTAWQRQEDELEAHSWVEAIQEGYAAAQEDAARQMLLTPRQRLTTNRRFSGRRFSVSATEVRQELDVERNDLANRLKGLKPLTCAWLRHHGYMIRMAELELERREKKARYDALIPSGSYDEDESGPSTPTPLWWEQRASQLAEELGRAQAHAIARPNMQYQRTSDGELFEETVFAARSLKRQREREHFDADALRTAAFAYQLCLNASHERALKGR